ncbi:MAG: DNA polymerase III subunit delta [Planctomycetes bacterium]|nr:DNA polymerase III subunit delta [Planctomycetota bacterium]
MAKKSGVVNALEYLSQTDKHPIPAVCAIFGDDAFLKSEVLAAIRRHVLEGDDSFSLTTFTGKEAQLREVLDALATVSLFGGGRRLVIVEEADPFVTEYRSQLEDYVAKPAKGGVLVLDVKTWPGNTRLAKAVAADGLAIECKTPAERQLKSWLVERAKAEHQVRLDAAAADALLELVPPELGILVQEVAKLALMAGDGQVIDVKLVRENVGGWRARTTWDMIDAAADGRAAAALAQLDRLIAAGEKPHGLLPQMASSLRRFATAMELIEAADARRQRLPLRNALSQAGVLPFKLNDAERQLRQIGRARAKQLTRWLLAADLAIKSHNSADDAARIELERLIVRLAAESHQEGARQGAGRRPTLDASSSVLPASS